MKKLFFVLIALVICGVFYASWGVEPRQAANSHPKIATKPTTSSNASTVTSTEGLVSLPNLDPFASLALKFQPPQVFVSRSGVEKLRRLRKHQSLHSAQLEALQSGDPLLFVHALYLDFPCFQESVQFARKDVRSHLKSTTLDPKTGKQSPIDEEGIAFTQLRANSGPQRIYPPQNVRAEMVDEQHALNEALLGRGESLAKLAERKRDYARETRLWIASLAPLEDSERVAFEQTRDELAELCVGSTFNPAFHQQYRETRDLLASRGTLSALIFNESSGWTSKRSLSELSTRDYALVEKGIVERHPDVLALLLTRGALHVDIDASEMPEDAFNVTMIGSSQARWLAACALGVADCGPTSSEFRQMCLTTDGCDQPDLAALWRFVLARDGLRADVFDQAAERVIDAIERNDLAALGIRRKTSP